MYKRKIKEISKRKNPYEPASKLKVCAYVRASTNHAGQLDSLKNQTEYYQRKLNATRRAGTHRERRMTASMDITLKKMCRSRSLYQHGISWSMSKTTRRINNISVK